MHQTVQQSGETILTPFMGIGSEAYEAIRLGRKAIGIELKQSYLMWPSKPERLNGHARPQPCLTGKKRGVVTMPFPSLAFKPACKSPLQSTSLRPPAVGDSTTPGLIAGWPLSSTAGSGAHGGTPQQGQRPGKLNHAAALAGVS